MGNETSKTNDNERITKSHIEAVMEKQRRIYERKHEELVAQTARQLENEQRRREEASVQQNATFASPTVIAGGGTQPQRPAPNFTSHPPPLIPPQPSTSANIYPNLASGNSMSNTMTHPSTISPQTYAVPAPSIIYPTYSAVQPTTSYEFRFSGPSAVHASVAPTAPFAPPAPSAPRTPSASSGPVVNSFIQPRSTSRSTSRFGPTLRSADGSELNCVTCSKRFGMTIYQCVSGHSSCKDCKSNSALCGRCHQPIKDIRNFDLEGYIAQIKTECPNAGDGCRLHFKQFEIESHLKECPFKEMACPIAEIAHCQWRGKLSQMTAHFKNVHPHHFYGEVDKEMVIFITENEKERQLHYVELGAFHFLVHIMMSKEEKMFYMVVQLIGTQVSASKWVYELHMYNKSYPRKKIQYTDVCQSSSIPIDEIYERANCVCVPMQYVSNFINDYSITYKFYIKKECDDNGKKVYRKQRARSAGKPKVFSASKPRNEN